MKRYRIYINGEFAESRIVGREIGPWGIEEYLETKQVHIKVNEQPNGWYS